MASAPPTSRLPQAKRCSRARDVQGTRSISSSSVLKVLTTFYPPPRASCRIGSACGLGTTGSATYDPGAVGASQFFYSVVVGQNATFQGSFGRGTSGAERPEAVGVGLCDQAQRLNVICPP